MSLSVLSNGYNEGKCVATLLNQSSTKSVTHLCGTYLAVSVSKLGS